MKIILIFFAFLLYPELFSQETHFVWTGTVCEEDGKTVPNAHIRIFSDERVFLFVTDARGRANIEYYRPVMSDTVLVTSVGYKPLKLSCNKLRQTAKIELEADIYRVGEVTVKPEKTKKKRNVKLGNKDWFTLNSASAAFGIQRAFFIENKNMSGKVLTLRYYMQDVFESEDRRFRPFRVRIYDVDTLTGKPGRDLLNEYLIVSLNKGHWLEVDVSQYNIQLPPKGIFVGMEVLSAEYYLSKGYITSSTVGEYKFFNTVAIGMTKRPPNTKLPYKSLELHDSVGWVPFLRSEFDFLINIIVEKKR